MRLILTLFMLSRILPLSAEGVLDSCNLTTPTSVGSYVAPATQDVLITNLHGVPTFRLSCNEYPFDCPVLGHIVNASDGTEIAIFTFDNITIAEGTFVYIVGTRPAALLSIGPIIINGTLYADGDSRGNAGAGGGVGYGRITIDGKTYPYDGVGPGGGQRANETEVRTGAGGAGLVGKGGNGGSFLHSAVSSDVIMGGRGGVSHFSVAAAEGLMKAGSGGGSGWQYNNGEARNMGGGGGGAFLLASLDSIVIGNMGKVSSNGGHGNRGARMRLHSPQGGYAGNAGGSGGGSGGVVLIRAPTVVNAGVVEAKGGNGGDFYWLTDTHVRQCGGGGGGGGYISIKSSTTVGDGSFNVSGGTAGKGNNYNISSYFIGSILDEEAGEEGIVSNELRDICRSSDVNDENSSSSSSSSSSSPSSDEESVESGEEGNSKDDGTSYHSDGSEDKSDSSEDA